MQQTMQCVFLAVRGSMALACWRDFDNDETSHTNAVSAEESDGTTAAVVRHKRSPTGTSTQIHTAEVHSFATVHEYCSQDAAVLYGRSFTLLTTQAAARLTAAEQNVFQQTVALPRLNQNAVCFGLGSGPIEATSTARPERFLGVPAARVSNPTIRPGKPAGFPLREKR